MKKTALRDTFERILTLFDEDPVGFVVDTDSFNRATKKHISSYGGVSVYRDSEWDPDKVGAFFDHSMFGKYKTDRMGGRAPKDAIDWGSEKAFQITKKVRFRKDGDAPPYDFITEPVRWNAEANKEREAEEALDHLDDRLEEMEEAMEEKKITIKLRPEFAVYVLSSLEVIREVLDENVTPDDSMNVKSRVAALEILCRELAVGLDERASREQIDAIIDELIDRYK